MVGLCLLVAGCLKTIPKQGDPPPLHTESWKLDGCNLVWSGQSTGQTTQQCYTDWKYRDASVLSVCPGAERSGALCYPPCRPGYSGTGPICWQNCPAGYHDDGAFCRRDVKIIGATLNCPWYDVCGLTFARGCSTCPEGYINDGCTCRQDVSIFAKDSFGRGVGTPMSCPQGTQQLGALCYGNCPAGYTASGVYCNANQQTCKTVPVVQPPDTAQLKRYCFTLSDPASWVRPCFGVSTTSDTLDDAKVQAQCQCSSCTLAVADCSAVDGGRACP
jgi:hypothetical protein